MTHLLKMIGNLFLSSVRSFLHKNLLTLALALTMLFAAQIANATSPEIDVNNTESRPVTGIYSIEIGRQNVLATYLSPLHYTGKTMGASGAWSKAMPFSPEHAIMHFDTHLNFANLANPARTATMLGFTGDFSWGMSWRTMLPWQIQATAGGTAGIRGGAYYLTRNGNNPVEAIANAGISIRVSLARPFHIKRLPILLRDEVSLPTLGVFFNPEYGETYYEIYLGNHKGLVHAGWWGNNFSIDNTISATLDFGRTAMTVGYRFNAYTQWACNLNTKIMTHSFVIGVIPGGIGLKKKNRCHKHGHAVYSLYNL